MLETAAKSLSLATVPLVSESIFQTPKQNYSHSILKYLQSGIKQGCCCIIYHGNSGCSFIFSLNVEEPRHSEILCP